MMPSIDEVIDCHQFSSIFQLSKGNRLVIHVQYSFDIQEETSRGLSKKMKMSKLYTKIF